MIRYIVLFVALWGVVYVGITTWQRWSWKKRKRKAWDFAMTFTVAALAALITLIIIIAMVIAF